MEIHGDFKELLALFNVHAIEYVVGGGYVRARFLGAVTASPLECGGNDPALPYAVALRRGSKAASQPPHSIMPPSHLS